MSLFREVRLLYRGIPSSLANSSGIFLDDKAHCDVVRPGVALYGVNPTPGRPNPMRPVIFYFEADQYAISRGESVTLRWDLANAESANLRYDDRDEAIVRSSNPGKMEKTLVAAGKLTDASKTAVGAAR